jgi:hypothetical protein
MAKVRFVRSASAARELSPNSALADALRGAGLTESKRPARAVRKRLPGRVKRTEITDYYGSVLAIRERWEELPTSGQ